MMCILYGSVFSACVLIFCPCCPNYLAFLLFSQNDMAFTSALIGLRPVFGCGGHVNAILWQCNYLLLCCLTAFPVCSSLVPSDPGLFVIYGTQKLGKKEEWVM
ncbi:hypothetical protein COLO4_03786 [Corchorus olitorius]|uniref:Uncharacterized protein n=1 Tax=Corchorus olitorius TaxID=93759 RepID=A0A1R3KWL8_9ROSI|nr:hypothetical protein COLO4_03786 [Corchorus olitorius]